MSILTTNFYKISGNSRGELRVLRQEGELGGSIASNWTRIQDGGQKAAIWLDIYLRWRMEQDWAE